MTALLIAIGLIACLLAYIASKPDAFQIERTLAMNATPETVFAQINDLHNFNRWNPFALADPAIVLSYTGAESGVGAAYAWNSSGRAGKGSMEIIRSTLYSNVLMDLKFEKPFAAHNVAEFGIAPANEGSIVTWAMTGNNKFIQKLMGAIFNMDKMVGGEFAKGLENLKALVER